MQKVIGLWIDHREATIITISDAGEVVQHLDSGVEKHVRFAGAEQGTAEDARDRRFGNHLKAFYETVSTHLREAEVVFIFGPGEAKGELAKLLENEGVAGRTVEVERSDKLTEGQIAAKVREHFASHV